MNEATRDILLNREVIAMNQDPLGRQGYRVGRHPHGREIASAWAKPLESGAIAVGLFNLGQRHGRLAMVAWQSLGLNDRRPCRVRNLWTRRPGRIHGQLHHPRRPA